MHCFVPKCCALVVSKRFMYTVFRGVCFGITDVRLLQKKPFKTEEILCTSVHLNLLKRHKHEVHMTQGLEISHPAAFCLEPMKLQFYSQHSFKPDLVQNLDLNVAFHINGDLTHMCAIISNPPDISYSKPCGSIIITVHSYI